MDVWGGSRRMVGKPEVIADLTYFRIALTRPLTAGERDDF
jgi:hypothetical protein